MKFSKQRELILDTIMKSDIHPTADYIYNSLKKDNPNLSLGTVYRNLAQLVDNGFIHKVSMPNQSDRFDKNIKPHAHIICDVCNEVYDIDSSSLKCFINDLSSEHDVDISSYNIVFKGVCKSCKKLT
ncbi:MAG: Fur family transcriptional regulator [Clostridium sp.]